MRALEFVTEVFEPGKQNWKWRRQSSDEAFASFVVADREYQWHAFSSEANPAKWEIQFRLMRASTDPDGLDLFGKTGTGNSAQVLSTAVDITRSFLQTYGLDKVEEITFNAKEDSRINLYAKMIQRLLPNWDLSSRKSRDKGMQFTLTDTRAYDKPENKIKDPLKELFAPGGNDEDSNDPYQYPKPEHYARSIDFFGQFEAEHFDKEDMNDATGEFKGYWDYDGKLRQIAYFKFDNAKRTGSNHPGMGWYYEPQNEDVAGSSLNEFAPGGQGGSDSGRWYTDDELADIIGDDWFEDFDVSHDEFNIDAYGEKAKQNLVSYANTWFDDKGYNVNVLGVEHNDVDHDLKWYIVGSFHNPGFANKGVAEGKQPGKPVVDAILKVIPVAQEIWFHGSRATGKHRRNSDTDILVVVPDDLVGDQYLAVVRILQKLSSHFDNYDIQPTKLGTNIHRIAQEEGKLLWSKQGVAESYLDELANTSLKVKEPKNFVNVNDRNQVIYKVMKFKSGKDTYLINFTVKGAPAYGKKSNWNAVNVSFGVREEQDDYSFGDEINTDLTARNKNQFLIYSTVINAVRKFITEYNTEIDEIIMQGAGERQAVMYQRFFQSAGKYFPGWHYDGKHSLVRDVPRQPAKKVREQGVAEGSEQKMSVQDTLAYLKKVMGTESHEDWRNHIINTNEYFVLKDISVNSLKSDLSGLNKTNVEKYKQMDFSKAPPIVIGSDGNILDGYHRANVAKALKVPTLKAWIGVKKQGVAEGSENLSYIGNCTDDDVIEYIFGDATNFAQAVEEHGDEFTIDDLVVKYDPESDVHSFYYKKQGVAENFADGKKPGRKGLAKRVGVDCKQPISKLRSIASNSSGERQRMAHWCANMKSGKKK